MVKISIIKNTVKKEFNMFKVPNILRDRSVPGNTIDAGNNGAFVIRLSQSAIANVIASDGLEWEHVSVHIVCAVNGSWNNTKMRTPTWSEMCKIKEMFWDEEDCVVQYHPSKSQYVNMHKHVLHLWRPINQEIPVPPKGLV